MKPKPHSIMYAPWRENYANIANNSPQTKKLTPKSCIFCTIHENQDNSLHRILYRGTNSFIMLSSQPYVDNGIHFLIIPYEHKREIGNLSTQTYKEVNIFTQKLCALFSPKCNEIYININQGTSAGASIPNHFHKHIIFNKSCRYYNLIEAIKATQTTINLESLFQTLQSDFSFFDIIKVPQQINKNICYKNCYYCSILTNNDAAQENLIIHRGKHASIMLSHYPTYFGEIDIIPNEHIESIETIPSETYEEINDLTITIYPLLLKLLNTEDCNVGSISYGAKATDTEHIKQKVIPRKNTWNTTSTTRAYHFNNNVINFYNRLVLEWENKLLDENQTKKQAKL